MRCRIILAAALMELSAVLAGVDAGFTIDADPDSDDIIFRTSKGGKVYPISKSEGRIIGGLGPELKGAKVGQRRSGPEKGKQPGGVGGKGQVAKSTGSGLKMQEKYGGNARYDGVGNGSNGAPVLIEDRGETIIKHDDPDLQKGNHSLLKHADANGKLTQDRENLHKAIFEKHFAGVAKAEGQPTYYMMGGGPAAGKSSLMRAGLVSVPDKFNGVTVNSDDIKKELPEYGEMVNAGNKLAAGYVHEESSALTKRVMASAMKGGYNVVLDGTGDSSVKSVMSKIREARANGMRVEGYYVTIPTAEAVRRSEARAKGSREKGRWVDPNIVKNTHRRVSAVLPQVAKEFDKVELYDNSGDKPVLIAYGGGGKDLMVVNQKLYDAFIAKASETD